MGGDSAENAPRGQKRPVPAKGKGFGRAVKEGERCSNPVRIMPARAIGRPCKKGMRLAFDPAPTAGMKTTVKRRGLHHDVEGKRGTVDRGRHEVVIDRVKGG